MSCKRIDNISMLERSLINIVKCACEDKNYNSNMNNGENISIFIQDFEKEVISKIDSIKPFSLELLSNAEDIGEIATNISNELFFHYKIRNLAIKDAEKCRIIISRMIMTLCYELSISEEQSSRIMNREDYYSFIYEMLKHDLDKLFYYIKHEPILACFFEDYA